MGIRVKVILSLVVLGFLTATTSYVTLSQHQHHLIHSDAQQIAEIVSSQILADRAVYTQELVAKLSKDGTGAAVDSHRRPGYIKLPSQFIRSVSKRVEKKSGHLYRYRLLSQWNINREQGLRDEFDRWAWGELVSQELALRGTIPGPEGFEWKPITQVSETAQGPVFSYIRADPASAPACVSCHNRWEKDQDIQNYRRSQGTSPGKSWHQHQLMGALRVDVPLAAVEDLAEKGRLELVSTIMGLTLLGLVLLGALLYWAVIKPCENALREVKEFDEVIGVVAGQSQKIKQDAQRQLSLIKERGIKNKELMDIAFENARHSDSVANDCKNLETRFLKLKSKLSEILGHE